MTLETRYQNNGSEFLARIRRITGNPNGDHDDLEPNRPWRRRITPLRECERRRLRMSWKPPCSPTAFLSLIPQFISPFFSPFFKSSPKKKRKKKDMKKGTSSRKLWKSMTRTTTTSTTTTTTTTTTWKFIISLKIRSHFNLECMYS